MKRIEIVIPEPLIELVEETSTNLGVERDSFIRLAIHEKLDREGITGSWIEHARSDYRDRRCT